MDHTLATPVFWFGVILIAYVFLFLEWTRMKFKWTWRHLAYDVAGILVDIGIAICVILILVVVMVGSLLAMAWVKGCDWWRAKAI